MTKNRPNLKRGSNEKRKAQPTYDEKRSPCLACPYNDECARGERDICVFEEDNEQ